VSWCLKGKPAQLLPVAEVTIPEATWMAAAEVRRDPEHARVLAEPRSFAHFVVRQTDGAAAA
jgi:hypothetical protein